jgi:peroxiredoxin
MGHMVMSLSTSCRVVPNFALPDRQGRSVSLRDYKHRQPVVLVFCGECDAPLLYDFAHHYPAYAQAGAEILAILPACPDLDEFPFPVLRDQDDQLTARLVESTPAVWVLDSFNELSAQFQVPAPPGSPHVQILSALAEVELKCPECGVPEWPQRAAN